MLRAFLQGDKPNIEGIKTRFKVFTSKCSTPHLYHIALVLTYPVLLHARTFKHDDFIEANQTTSIGFKTNRENHNVF